MATDATGTPSSPDSIPTYNTAVDSPSGKGLNAIVAAIQTALSARIAKTLTSVTGDIIYASGANTPARLGVGSAGQVLGVSGGVPAWVGNGMQLILDSTLGSDQASFDTNTILGGNIPGTYKHLHVKLVTRTSSGNGFDAVNVQANGITTASYASSWMQATAGAVGHTIGLAATSARAGITTGVATGSWAQAAIDFLDYTNANNKNLQGVSSVVKNNASNADFVNEQNYAWISGVSTAITRLVFTPSAGNWKAGSRLTIYGLG